MDIENAKKLRGWMSDHELHWLAEQAAKCNTIIEIGCAYGRSTLAMAENCSATIYAVDTWVGSPAELLTNHKDYKELEGDFAIVAFYSNLAENINAGIVRPMRMHSRNAALYFQVRDLLADMIFIDGCHDYEAVLEDIANYMPLLVSGGILCGHDYDDSNWPGVKKAVDELLPEHKIAPLTRIWYVKL